MTWLSKHRAAMWVFLLALLLGILATVSVHRSSQMQVRAEFDRVAVLAVDRVVFRMRQHVVALRAGRGLWAAMSGEVTREAFMQFVTSVDLVKELAGARAIGFAPMIPKDQTALVAAQIFADFGIRVPPPEDTGQLWRTPVALVEPATVGMMRALGFDMYADPTRRAAMDAAIRSNDAQISGPINLVSAAPGQIEIGFLVFLPVDPPSQLQGENAAPTAGFIYAAFFGQELITAALASGPSLPVSVHVTDAAAPDQILHDGGSADAGLEDLIEVPLLGRQWNFLVRSTTDVRWLDEWGRTFLLGLVSLAFAGTIAYAVAARQNEAAKARELAAAATRESGYRDLLMQEMKHRIKNYITRIQSIARQSARGAVDVKAFTDTFDARLRAMASVQEILAGTALAEADVRTILRKELQQCLDTESVEHLMDGPPLRLDERQSHAFALVVHELVTNAMKYGGLSANGRGLRVTWTEDRGAKGEPHRLALTWRELFDEAAPAPHAGSGFGSRLIEASLKGELSGMLERDFGPDGLLINLSFPLTVGTGTATGATARPPKR